MPACVSAANRPKRKRKLAGAKSQATVWAAIIIVVSVVVDQVTKHLAVSHLVNAGSVRVLGDIVQFTLVYNEGGAMGTNFGSSTYYLVISLIVLPVLFVFMYRHRDDTAMLIPLAFITGGAIGNLIDRIRMGRVVDFLDVDFLVNHLWGDARWWTFNVADACISVAIVFLLYRTLFHYPDKAGSKAEGSEAPVSPTEPDIPT